MENPQCNQVDSCGNARRIQHVITEQTALKELGWQFQGSPSSFRGHGDVFSLDCDSRHSLSTVLLEALWMISEPAVGKPPCLLQLSQGAPRRPNSQNHASLPLMLLFLSSFIQLSNMRAVPTLGAASSSEQSELGP